jgi:hypothetical protein
VWIIGIEDDRAIDRMRRIGDAVEAFASPQRAERAHVTVFVCGFPASHPTLDDDIAEELLEAQVAALAGAGDVDLVVHGANCFTTCAFVDVSDPAGALVAWREALAATYPAGHRGEVRFDPYVPHLTAATFDDAFPTRSIVDVLGPLRELEPLTIRCPPPVLVDFDATRAHAPLRRRQ